MTPTLILGGNYEDDRGILKYNNEFDISLVKRMYIIENVDTVFIRCWQGHKIEQRWFTAVVGKFKIDLIKPGCLLFIGVGSLLELFQARWGTHSLPLGFWLPTSFTTGFRIVHLQR